MINNTIMISNKRTGIDTPSQVAKGLSKKSIIFLPRYYVQKVNEMKN